MIGIDSVTWNGDLGHTLTFGEGGYKVKEAIKRKEKMDVSCIIQ